MRSPSSRSSSDVGRIVGYSGVAWFDFEGARRLEFGYHLLDALGVAMRYRGRCSIIGLAATDVWRRAARNDRSAVTPRPQAVIGKLDFTFRRQAELDGYPVDPLYRRTFT